MLVRVLDGGAGSVAQANVDQPQYASCVHEVQSLSALGSPGPSPVSTPESPGAMNAMTVARAHWSSAPGKPHAGLPHTQGDPCAHDMPFRRSGTRSKQATSWRDGTSLPATRGS